MLKLFFVAAIVLTVILIIVWAFFKIADRAKKNRNKTVGILEATLEELKKQSATLEELKQKAVKDEPKKEDSKPEVK